MILRIKRMLRLYIMYVSVIVKSTMQYKLSFVLMLIGRFLVSFTGFLSLAFVFSGFTDIKGYSYSDVLLCFSIVQMSFAFAECLGSSFKVFSGIIRSGEFDRMLIRPRSPIIQVIGTKFELGRLAALATAIVTLVIGIKESQINWGISNVMTMVFMVLGGTILFIALFLLEATFCFFTIEDGGILNMLTYGAQEHCKYPLDIYGKGIKYICTYLIPYTLVQYYPLQYLLGKTERWYYALYPFGAFLFLGLCYTLWLYGVRNYKSTGS